MSEIWIYSQGFFVPMELAWGELKRRIKWKTRSAVNGAVITDASGSGALQVNHATALTVPRVPRVVVVVHWLGVTLGPV